MVIKIKLYEKTFEFVIIYGKKYDTIRNNLIKEFGYEFENFNPKGEREIFI